MNLFLIRPRYPSALLRFASPDTPLMHRLLAPPRRLLSLAAAYPTSWQKRVIDLSRSAFDSTALRPGDTAILGWALGSMRGLRRIVKMCRDAAVHLILPKPSTPAGGTPSHGELPPCGSAERLPLWDLVSLNEYSTVSIPVCESPSATHEADAAPVRFRAPEGVIEELDRLQRSSWAGPMHLYARDGSWAADEALTLLDALARRADGAERAYRLCAEFTTEDAADRRVTSLMVNAGIREVTLTMPVGAVERDGLGDDRSLIGLVKTLQRAGLQVRGGVPVRDRRSTWTGLARDVTRLRLTGMDRTLRQLLGSPLGARHMAVALRAGQCAGLSSVARQIGSLLARCVRLGVRPDVLPLLATIAAYSELQYAADALA